jgi:hypothetical protein
MYLDGEHWNETCDSAYSDNVAMFALSFEKITGYIPLTISGENLPLERQDIWGTMYEHPNKDIPKRTTKTVLIEKIGTIDDVEVYGQAKAEGWLAKSQRG